MDPREAKESKVCKALEVSMAQKVHGVYKDSKDLMDLGGFLEFRVRLGSMAHRELQVLEDYEAS